MQNGNSTLPFRTKGKAWLELLRVQNLFTVPGDPLAGMFLALAAGGRSVPYGSGSFWIKAGLLIPASLMLYAAGLILNDYADYREDSISRPMRPLPSFRITKSQALFTGLLLLCISLVPAGLAGVRTFSAAVILALCLLLYNFLLKPVPYLGALNMGLCRGMNMILGGFAVTDRLLHPLLLPAALFYTFYIGAVTVLAKEETNRLPQGFGKFLPLAGILSLLFLTGYYSIPVVFSMATGPGSRYTLPASLFFLIPAIACFVLGQGILLAVRLYRSTLQQLPGLIGAHIRLLIPVQALFCSLGLFLILAGKAGKIPGIPLPEWELASGLLSSLAVPPVLFAFYFLAGRAGRYFYGS